MKPPTILRPSASRNRVAPDHVIETGLRALVQASARAADGGTLRPTLQSRPAPPATVGELKKHEIPGCRTADLLFTRCARSDDRIEAVAFGIISLSAVGSIVASFSVSFSLIQHWQSFVTFVESVIK